MWRPRQGVQCTKRYTRFRPFTTSTCSEVPQLFRDILADIAAKCGYGFMIYAIARSKMESEGVSLETLQPAAAGAA